MSSAAFEIAANVLIAGSAAGAALVLTDTLSFWGGFDPQTGEIIDVHHPQYRQRVGGGSGPRAFVLGERDVNISVGVLVANRLYDLSIPVVEITPQAMSKIGQGERIEIDFEGTILVNPEAG
jgi:predicted aconitase with swiveling domain